MGDAALLALSDFETGRWGKKYNAITPLWWRPREQVTPFFALPPEISASSTPGAPRQAVGNRTARPRSISPCVIRAVEEVSVDHQETGI